jgi:hypothetical protein
MFRWPDGPTYVNEFDAAVALFSASPPPEAENTDTR